MAFFQSYKFSLSYGHVMAILMMTIMWTQTGAFFIQHSSARWRKKALVLPQNLHLFHSYVF